jgi:hypothetical protein
MYLRMEYFKYRNFKVVGMKYTDYEYIIFYRIHRNQDMPPNSST